MALFQTEDRCLRVISHPENASGLALFQSFPDTVIYVTKHRLKSKGKGFVLIGLCFAGKIGLVKRRVGRGYNPHKTMCSHCPIVLPKILNPPHATLDGLHFVHTVLDHLHSDLICSPLVKHLLRTNSAIWLREVPSSGLTAASGDVYIEVTGYGAYWSYMMHTSGAQSGSPDLQTAGCS